MHLHSYVDSAKKILNDYDGAIPFAAYLKNYFGQNKKHGSRDRKMIAGLCYCFFRLGNSFQKIDINERLLVGQFLCSDSSNIFLGALKPEWNEMIAVPVEEKLEYLSADSNFPLENELSEEIDKDLFSRSFLIQPDLFLRVRPGNKEIVLNKLEDSGIDFYYDGEYTIRLPNSSKVENLLLIDEEVVVQDLNSQKVLNFPELQTSNSKLQTSVWDCCAGSGGKSILLFDCFSNIQLTVSDVRESILINLRKRFEKAGIKKYRNFIADLSKPNFQLPISDFDLVICDAPCSGSGTWSRTPEQLLYFDKARIEYYSTLQKTITANASKALKPGGYLLYVTCSVFRKENEDVVDWIANNTSLKKISHQYFKGYTTKADTLFAALFQL